jgi:hypothetical protein
MFKISFMRAIPFALVCVGTTVLLDCAPAPNRERWSEGERAQAVASSDRLTGAEASAYRDDQQYVHRLVKPGERVRLNYADPRQYNFAMARLKLAGKNARNSPYLFELIEARRQQQTSRAPSTGTSPEPIQTEASTGRNEEHVFQRTDIGDIQPAPALVVAATGRPVNFDVSSSTEDGNDYTAVDSSVTTVTGATIAPLQFKEEYAKPDGSPPGTYVSVSTQGDTSASAIKRYTFESYKITVRGEDFNDSFIYEEKGAVDPQTTAVPPRLSKPIIQEPVDKWPIPLDNRIHICMDRAWESFCDFVLTGGGPQSVQVPLKGQVSVPADVPYVFNWTKINKIKSDLDNGLILPESETGFVKLVLANAGGGCNVTDGTTMQSKMSTFWKRVTLSADNRTLSWDLTGANAAQFGQNCRQVQDKAVLTARIPLQLVPVAPLVAPPFDDYLEFTSDPDLRGAIKPITLTNSCLAEGTQVQLSDGKTASIESLHIGQNVFNPYASKGHFLTITDTAKGTERSPMVRIRDEAGHTLLLTEMHPIATADRGMVQARALQTGDLVMTKQGPSKLAEVSREPYGGKVYNLKVGSGAQMASLGQDETIMYANGFVVGDGQIQSKYEALATGSNGKTGVELVAERWRRDYLFSAERK